MAERRMRPEGQRIQVEFRIQSNFFCLRQLIDHEVNIPKSIPYDLPGCDSSGRADRARVRSHNVDQTPYASAKPSRTSARLCGSRSRCGNGADGRACAYGAARVVILRAGMIGTAETRQNILTGFALSAITLLHSTLTLVSKYSGMQYSKLAPCSTCGYEVTTVPSPWVATGCRRGDSVAVKFNYSCHWRSRRSGAGRPLLRLYNLPPGLGSECTSSTSRDYAVEECCTSQALPRRIRHRLEVAVKPAVWLASWSHELTASHRASLPGGQYTRSPVRAHPSELELCRPSQPVSLSSAAAPL